MEGDIAVMDIEMNLCDELEAEYKKSGLFDANDIPISYELGFPILDEQLGSIVLRPLPNGDVLRQRRIGVPAGTFTIVAGESSTGKTTAAIQGGWNIVEPFCPDGVVIHIDEERSTTYDRVMAVTGAELDDIQKRYKIIQEGNTWESVLSRIIAIAKKKEADPKRYKYNTGVYDIYGNEIVYYIPTVIIIDSLMKMTSDNEDITTISGLTAGGREAIYRGKFMRNALPYMSKYNINVILVHHTDDDMAMQPGKANPKQLTHMPTGKHLGGGKKVINYTSSIIIFISVNNKDELKTEEDAGYYGHPIKALVSKARTANGGTIARQEFVERAGFDPQLTLLNFAKDKGLIVGRNPSCYFDGYPETKFDTRCFLKELESKPELQEYLLKCCKPELEKLIPVLDLTSQNTDPIHSSSAKRNFRKLMRESSF